MHRFRIAPITPRARHLRLGLLALAATALLAGACDDGGDETGDPESVGVTVTETGILDGTGTAVATEATPTAEATETATATETITAPEVVERDEISFVSPEGWVGNEDTWTSPDGEVTLLFASREREAGSEPEAVMLPPGAVNLDRTETETPLGPGALHTIELVETTAENVYERHALVITDDRIYDWWIAARSLEELDAQQDVLDEVLASIQREDG